MKHEFDSYSRSDFFKKLHIRNTTGLGTLKDTRTEAGAEIGVSC